MSAPQSHRKLDFAGPPAETDQAREESLEPSGGNGAVGVSEQYQTRDGLERALLEWLHATTEQGSATGSPRCESKNKALVLEAFDTLFNKPDYKAAQRFWSPNYIQHGAHIEPGRKGLFNLIKSLPPTLKYEPFSGFGQPTAWVAADIVRITDGVLTEHWDVIE
jgi:predicted SnoaL-like aldol condensation-catalyzing enzyme